MTKSANNSIDAFESGRSYLRSDILKAFGLGESMQPLVSSVCSLLLLAEVDGNGSKSKFVDWRTLEWIVPVSLKPVSSKLMPLLHNIDRTEHLFCMFRQNAAIADSDYYYYCGQGVLRDLATRRAEDITTLRFHLNAPVPQSLWKLFDLFPWQIVINEQVYHLSEGDEIIDFLRPVAALKFCQLEARHHRCGKLTVLTNETRASLIYQPDAEQHFLELETRDQDETTALEEFIYNGQGTELLSSQTLGRQEGIIAFVEFFGTKALPVTINWIQRKLPLP